MPRERLLIVEDSDFFASVVLRALREGTSFEIDRVGSFKEARAYLRRHEDELFAALLDLHLPDSPNGEVVDYVAGRDVPSIVFTGEFNARVRNVVMSKNVVDYVLKEGPDSLRELIAALERLRRNSEVKALVVDDSASARNLVAGLLRTHRYQVMEAGDGESALTLLQRNPDIRLLITDFNMPGMDGVELVRAVRATYPRDRLAVIGLSAESDALISARFIKSGANDFLRKPFIVEEFHCRIDQNMELLRKIALIRDMAEKDDLTGLDNRRHFLQRARSMHREALTRHFPLQTVLLDIDHFRKINEAHGHEVGDEVLREMGRSIAERFGRTGLVARYSGEEFAMLLPGAPLDQTRRNLQAFLNDIAEHPAQTTAGPVPCTLSVGFAAEPGESLEAMLREAEESLTRSQEGGVGCLDCML